MNNKAPLSRREFAAASTVAAAAAIGTSPTALADEEKSLAILGGKKTVTEAVPAWERWGEPEAERLDDLLEQSSLFYWNGPQTNAFTNGSGNTVRAGTCKPVLPERPPSTLPSRRRELLRAMK